MAALLDVAPEVEGVFAVSDLAAVGALMERHRRGIDVPRRLSLPGFGNLEIGQQMVPPSSMIGVDFPDLGKSAGAMIVDLLQHAGTGGDERIDVGFNVIARGTTRTGPTSDCLPTATASWRPA